MTVHAQLTVKVDIERTVAHASSLCNISNGAIVKALFIKNSSGSLNDFLQRGLAAFGFGLDKIFFSHTIHQYNKNNVTNLTQVSLIISVF